MRESGVQNGVARSCGSLKLKVESEKSMELESIMFNGSLNPRSDC